ncbi:50S ribosomal protein L11 [Candidatus Woesearchaeota archaeon]|nr:50S ribosomal protein L11 [Candidatus Woesearchaeota archaeon]
MAKQSIEVLIEGGKATAAPPLGPALGPLGVNIGQVVTDINKKTGDFKGMQVPVTVNVDSDTKEYTISIGTPPASSLIKKEAEIKKGASNSLTDKVADLKIQQIMKIANMKQDSLLGKTSKDKVKEIIGTCQSMGVMIEGKAAPETLKDIDEGKYDSLIASGRTELTAEEIKEQEEEKIKLENELKERRDEFLTSGKAILGEMGDKSISDIRAKMAEEGIPGAIINELAPEEKKEEVKQ